MGEAQRWIRNSYPFFHADRIVTPTLFICGDADLNVPLLNGEQMYQALKSLKRETELVIYPDEPHSLPKAEQSARPDGAHAGVVREISASWRGRSPNDEVTPWPVPGPTLRSCFSLPHCSGAVPGTRCRPSRTSDRAGTSRCRWR